MPGSALASRMPVACDAIQGNDEQAENELRGLPPRHAKGREEATRAVEIDKPAGLTAPPGT